MLLNPWEPEPLENKYQEPEPLENKFQEPEPLGEKIRSRNRLEKIRSRWKPVGNNSGTGAGKRKLSGSSALKTILMKVVYLRIGRTGRAGKTGKSISLFTK